LEKLREFSEVGKPYLVLFSGKAGTGKTTSANFLLEWIEAMGAIDYRKFSFAEKIKSVAKESFGWDSRKDEAGRVLLQDVGGIGRKYDKNIWVRELYRNVQRNPAVYDFVIVDDWRFPNELLYLQDTDRFFISTVRMVAPSRETLRGFPASQDKSETSLPASVNDPIYDYVLYNDLDVSLEELRKKTLELLVSMVLKQYTMYTRR
jgi:hypothetical protein